MSEYAGKNGLAYARLKSQPNKKILIDGSSSTFAFYWSAALRTHQSFQKVRIPAFVSLCDLRRFEI